jgi:hypothetical protein
MAAGDVACGRSFEARRKGGEHLRMTAEIFSFINIKFLYSLSPSPEPHLS